MAHLRRRLLVLPTFLLGFLPAAAGAQAPPAAPPAHAGPSPSIDVSKLPLDLQRIERQLRQTTEREDHDGLRLRYFVDVYGTAPRIELFMPGENLTTGPTPWGAPTHQEMIDHNTPQEFRSPPVDLNSVFRWLTDKLDKK